MAPFDQLFYDLSLLVFVAVRSMRQAAEAVLGPLHEECVATRESSGGRYTR